MICLTDRSIDELKFKKPEGLPLNKIDILKNILKSLDENICITEFHKDPNSRKLYTKSKLQKKLYQQKLEEEKNPLRMILRQSRNLSKKSYMF